MKNSSGSEQANGIADNMTLFAMVPIEVYSDQRLTLQQHRVLGVLCSFREKGGNVVWPSREKIAERCAMHVANISKATSDLERMGWLKKEGKGGWTKATRYTICIPDTVAEPTTVVPPTTVVESATSTLADSTTRELVDSTRGKEQTTGTDQGTEKRASSNEVAGKPTPPPCPHQEIVNLYHELLPMCPQIRDWTPARQQTLRSRWISKPKYQSFEWWRKFFNHVAASDFLTGRAHPRSGHAPFLSDLEWLIQQKNFVKVIEGKYDNRPEEITA
jgi:hypothetical protein